MLSSLLYLLSLLSLVVVGAGTSRLLQSASRSQCQPASRQPSGPRIAMTKKHRMSTIDNENENDSNSNSDDNNNNDNNKNDNVE